MLEWQMAVCCCRSEFMNLCVSVCVFTLFLCALVYMPCLFVHVSMYVYFCVYLWVYVSVHVCVFAVLMCGVCVCMRLCSMWFSKGM